MLHSQKSYLDDLKANKNRLDELQDKLRFDSCYNTNQDISVQIWSCPPRVVQVHEFQPQSGTRNVQFMHVSQFPISIYVHLRQEHQKNNSIQEKPYIDSQYFWTGMLLHFCSDIYIYIYIYPVPGFSVIRRWRGRVPNTVTAKPGDPVKLK